MIILNKNLPVYNGSDIKYFIIPRYYTYTVTYWNHYTYSHVFPKEIEYEGTKNYHEFSPPAMLEIDKEQNIIQFNVNDAFQRFMTKMGIKDRVLSAVFKPDPADNYSQ
jgi:hypothetical protein